MTVPTRHAFSNTYRYGFQGQEKDDEIKDENNSLNYKFRMHDPRVGRFFAVDPLTAKYPWYSPYQFSGNRVIDGIELEGLEVTLYYLGFNKKRVILATAYEVKNKIHTLFGTYKTNDFRMEIVRGTDGHFHRMPEAQYEHDINTNYENQHLSRKEVIDKVNSWPLADKEAKIVYKVKTLEAFGKLGAQIIYTAAPIFAEVGIANEVEMATEEIAVVEEATQISRLERAEQRAAKLSKIDRSGKDFTQAGKKAVIELNEIENEGLVICEDCGVETIPATQSKKGVTPSKFERQVDHIDPKSKGGSGTPNNGQVLCRDCNIKKSNH